MKSKAELAEYWQRMGRVYERLDRETPEMEVERCELQKLKCKDCGQVARMRWDHYAMTRPDPWMLMWCRCPGKFLWVNVKR